MLSPESVFLNPAAEKKDQGEHESHTESAVANDCRRNMEGQPAGSQRWHQFPHLAALHGGVSDYQQDQRGRKSSQHRKAVLPDKDQANQAQRPGKADSELVLVGHRPASGTETAQYQNCGMQNKDSCLQDHCCPGQFFLLHDHKGEVHDRHNKVSDQRDCEKYVFSLKQIHSLLSLKNRFPPQLFQMSRGTERRPCCFSHGRARSRSPLPRHRLPSDTGKRQAPAPPG